MSDTRTLESIRFEAEEATYVEAGTDAGLVLEMDDSIGNDHPAQTYRIQPDALRGALSALTETLLETLECADADAITAGTIRKFQNWQRRTQGDPRGR